MIPVFVRAPYNYDVNAASDAAGFACVGDSMTKQSFAKEADINVIVDRFLKTGQLPDIRMPEYADFTSVMDFRGCMDAVVKSRESFDLLDAKVRARFNNDPALFVDFCLEEANWDEAKKLGLLSQAAIDRNRAEREKAAADERRRIEAEYSASLEKAQAKPGAALAQ